MSNDSPKRNDGCTVRRQVLTRTNAFVLAAILVSLFGCRKEEPKQLPPLENLPLPEKPREIPTHVEIPVPIDDSDRWLFVQKIAEKAKGGWATGSFDGDRNKLIITTSDVAEFALDTSRVAINWKKLVVLSIDGKNSELRKRDYDILQFTRTPQGEWTVREP
jgi:hypothetical protein